MSSRIRQIVLLVASSLTLTACGSNPDPQPATPKGEPDILMTTIEEIGVRCAVATVDDTVVGTFGCDWDHPVGPAGVVAGP